MTAPTPITGINSQYDDFNAADMSPLRRHMLVFSTNRGSKGHDFDLYKTTLNWRWVEESPPGPTPVEATDPQPFAPALMSDGNERGPILLDGGADGIGSERQFVLASDRAGGFGGLDLYAARCPSSYSNEVPCDGATELHTLEHLSSPGDDAYLSRPFAPQQLLFASNREGSAQMDIYAARWGAGRALADPPEAITKVRELSSDGDDTAPYVYGDGEVVFVSSRAGGLGEHDIYCSRLQAGRWTKPVDLGASINSPRDEYRPIVIEVNGTRFLIFSSTRDGGQGGYDLYIVGYAGCPR